MALFEHCRTPADAWDTFHEVARACHPAQGGTREDMGVLCDLARQALGDAWPSEWEPGTIPNMFDVYCRATGKPNPFGPVGIAAGAEAWPPPDPPAFDPSTPAFAWLPRGVGRVRLMYSGLHGR